MNGYELTEKMRRSRRSSRLTATEQALFYELVAICNSEGWVDSFRCSNMELCNALCGIDIKTLIRARQNLVNAGLIYYRSARSKKDIGSYAFENVFSGNIPPQTPVKTPVKAPPQTPVKTPNLIKYKTKTKKELEEAFENFRKMYPGSKRGLSTELENFCKKNKDADSVVLLLLPALKKLIDWRNKKRALGQFVPEFANLQTWINQKRWEVELEELEENGEKATYNIPT